MKAPLRTSLANVVVDASEMARRVIPPSQFQADTAAFIDVRIPGSAGKASYSFIGPGVSQNGDQKINLTEPHGFNVGAASMPHGVVNNQHMHYSAEVFICTRGEFEVRVGENCEQTLTIGQDTIFSAPTWIFRGFKNTGPDDGWLFAVLGGDDTGGILWAPQVLKAAAETGLYLTSDYDIIESSSPVPEAVAPIDTTELAELDSYTDDELAEFVVEPSELDWSTRALLSSVLAHHSADLAPVIGYGMSQDRRHAPKITNPHGFTIEWLRLEPGASTGDHRIADNQVLFMIDGDWSVEVNLGDDRLRQQIELGSIVSIPENAWRNLVNTGSGQARCLVVCGGDSPSRIDWHHTIISAAKEAGWGTDASGYIAPLALLGSQT